MKKISYFLIMLVSFNFLSLVSASHVWESADFNSYTNKAKINFNNSLSGYRDARENYIQSLNRFKSDECFKDQGKCETKIKDVGDKAKKHLLKAVEVISGHLLFLKTAVEKSNMSDDNKIPIIGEIQKDIEAINSKDKVIEGLSSSKEIAEFSNNFKIFWNEQQAKNVKYLGRFLAFKYLFFSEKLGEIIKKMELKAELLEKEGYNVDEIIKELERIKSNILSAKEKIKKADEIFVSILSTDFQAKSEEGKYFLNDSTKIIRDCYYDLKNLIVKFKIKNLKKDKKSEDKLLIKGEGVISFSGNGEISGKIGNENFSGNITIIDTEKNTEIEVSSGSKRSQMADGRVLYSEVKSVKIKGTKFKIDISSEFIDLSINGNGEINMKGNGLYKKINSYWTDISGNNLELNI